MHVPIMFLYIYIYIHRWKNAASIGVEGPHLDHSFLDLSILVFLRLAAPEVCTSLTAVFNSLRLKGGGTDTFPDGTEPPQRETARFTKLPRLSPQISWSFSIF